MVPDYIRHLVEKTRYVNSRIEYLVTMLQPSYHKLVSIFSLRNGQILKLICQFYAEQTLLVLFYIKIVVNEIEEHFRV